MARSVLGKQTVGGSMLPATAAYIEKVKRHMAEHPIDMQALTIETYRSMCSGYSEQSGSMAEGIGITKTTIPVDSGTVLKVKIFNTKGEEKTQKPALIWIPGGGFIAYLEGCHDSACSIMAKIANCRVILVEPRLAPEHKAPIPLQDTCKAVDYIFEHADEFHIDADNIMLGGDSSGANLSLGCALNRRDRSQSHKQLRHLVLVSGTYDLSLSIRGTEEAIRLRPYEKMDFINDVSFEYMFTHYLPTGMPRNDPSVSPYFRDMTGLPSVTTVVAEYDGVRTQTPALEKKLRAANVALTSKVVDGQTHSFLLLRGSTAMPDGEDPAQYIGEQLRAIFSEPSDRMQLL